MSMLFAIWLASLLLMGLSVAFMTVLILRRMAFEFGADRRRTQRGRVEAGVLAYIHGQMTAEELWRVADGRAVLIGDVGAELYDLVQGELRARLVLMLESVGVAERALRALRRGGRLTRFAAASRLRRFRHPVVAEALRHALDDPDANVRRVAAASLVEIDAAPPAAELVAKLRIGTAERSSVLRRVFRGLVPAQTSALAALLDGETSAAAKVFILDALAASGDYALLPKIIAMTEHPATDVRAEAFRTLAALAHPDCLAAVRRGLRDPAWEVVTQAAICAGRAALLEVIPVLVELLAHPMWWTRHRAAEALLAMGDRGRMALVAASEWTPGPAARTAQIILAEKAA